MRDGGGGVGQFPKKKNFSTAKTAEKNSCKGSHGEKIEQVMSTNQALCLTSLKNYYTSYATTQKIMHNLKKRKKFHDPENCPPPKKKEHNGLPPRDYQGNYLNNLLFVPY